MSKPCTFAHTSLNGRRKNHETFTEMPYTRLSTDYLRLNVDEKMIISSFMEVSCCATNMHIYFSRSVKYIFEIDQCFVDCFSIYYVGFLKQP